MKSRNLLLLAVLCCSLMSSASPMEGGDVVHQEHQVARGFPVVKVGVLLALGGVIAMGAKKVIDYSEDCNLSIANGFNCLLHPEQTRCKMMAVCLDHKGEKLLLQGAYELAKVDTSSEMQRLSLWLQYQAELAKLRAVYLVRVAQNVVAQ